MLTNETEVISSFELLAQDVKILNEERKVKFEKVSAIIFVKHSDENISEIKENYVGLIYKVCPSVFKIDGFELDEFGDFLISFR